MKKLHLPKPSRPPKIEDDKYLIFLFILVPLFPIGLIILGYFLKQ